MTLTNNVPFVADPFQEIPRHPPIIAPVVSMFGPTVHPKTYMYMRGSSGSMNDSDSENEIGRGRPIRRSSSVESSLRQAQTRSLSPTSDVGDPGGDAPKELPSTEDRPLIRQGVAFSWDSSKSLAPVQTPINTYEAQLPKHPPSRKPRFLPGQAVPVQQRAKRAKRNQEFSSQTGRFRLSNGLDAHTANGGLGELAQQTLSSVLNSPMRSAQDVTPPANRGRGRGRKSAATKTNQTQSGHELLVTNHAGPSNDHYRRNYDLECLQNLTVPFSTTSIDQHILSLKTRELAHQTQFRVNSRMVTLFITDLRSGSPDRQLAEINVPLSPADNPNDGFRVDAKDVCDQLQSSPSRIDGPAKVYTLRGEYRQFFLRVSETNIDDYCSANLHVSQKLSIDVFVEPAPHLVSSGSRPQSVDPSNGHVPNSPLTLRKRHRSPSASDRSSVASASQRIRAWQSFRQRSRSPSLGASSASSSLAPYKRLRTRDENLTSDKEHSDTSLILARGRARHFELPQQEIESQDIHQRIIQFIESIVQKEPGWSDFVTARLGTQRTKDLVLQYRFMSRILVAWEGRLVPCGFQQYLIRKDHILEAFGIEDDAFFSKCEETLKLVDMFGPVGKIRADPEIVDMMEEDDLPAPDRDVAVEFLQKLRSIHQVWKQSLPTIPRIL